MTTVQKEVILSQLYLKLHVSSIFLHHAYYDNYVDLIDEDQDPNFPTAIEASLLDKQTATSSDASDPELQPRDPWFSHDLNQLSGQKYALAGKLVAWSVLQGNNGPWCFSSEGYKTCRGATFDQALAIEEVADVQMKEILRATAACFSEEKFAEVIAKHADQISQYSYPKIYTVNLAHKKEVVDCLLKQNFDYGVHAEFAQFMEGMNSIGNFGNMVMVNQSVFEAILSSSHEKLTLSAFTSL